MNERRAFPWFYLEAYSIPLSDDLTARLGEIIVNWGAFENDLSRDIALLLRFPRARAHGIETPRTSFAKRIQFWRQTVHSLFPTVHLYREVASSLARDGSSIAKKRNRLIHGQWRHNTDEADPRWMVFSLKGVENTDIDGFYMDIEVATELCRDIIALRMKFVEFAVNRHWHAYLGILSESHEPTPDNPAYLTLQIDRWPQNGFELLNPKIPEELARMYLMRRAEN